MYICKYVHSVNLPITFEFVDTYVGVYEIYKDPVARQKYEQRLAEEEAKKCK